MNNNFQTQQQSLRHFRHSLVFSLEKISRNLPISLFFLACKHSVADVHKKTRSPLDGC